MSTLKMQSFIVQSKVFEIAEQEWNKLCEENGIKKLDQLVIESEEALGIETIRDIQKTIFLTPVQSKMKGLLIKNSQTLTAAAQNAFLKILEEPPSHAIILLHTTNIDSLLPTIQSRCFRIQDQKPLPSEALAKEGKLHFSSEGEKMELAEKFGKTKLEALNFLESQIFTYRQSLIENPNLKIAAKLGKMQEAYNNINTTNVSPRFILENLFLEL